ncbi:DUF421 domain-containing protein [Calderihabitans maritimus]|uniref:Predicted membrane protein n=1 Tax=Calderihabitans maritimus TaxID=1246530 RepID=A0A1Z5HUD1_9FIRM|nr:DUF421 domain-containing protein [Calderihabitans maritimus]GAW93143.1 predicted membrane protein [Calderihabitans maritimus]
MSTFIEVFLQTVLAFFAILFYARILGKQQIGQLTFFEYINGITFGGMAAVLATDIGPQRTWMHFMGLTVFAVLTFLMGYVSLQSRAARKLIAGEPTIVIHNGKVLEDNMKKMRYNVDELLMQLREKDVFNIADVEFAILEPDGNLSVLPKSHKQPLKPADLGLSTQYEGIPSEIIVDGEIIHQNLRQNNLDEKWLLAELQKQGITSLKEVALAILDTQGKLHIDKKKDDLQYTTDITDQP